MRLPAVSILAFVTLVSGFDIQSRILNGVLSDYKEYPFYVYTTSSSGKCGAAILSNRWILTAAHCLATPNVEIKMFFGLTAAGKCRGNATVPPSNQYVYPKYNSTSYLHDIALLELPEPITLTESIQPAKLTNICAAPHMGGQPVTAAGTGRTKMDERASDFRIRHARFVTMSSESCSEQMRYKLNPLTVLCANANGNHQAIYKGDSGGPLVWYNNGNLMGIMSFVQYFSSKNKQVRFQAFTNVPYYYGWIEQRTGLKLPNCAGPQAYSFP